MISDVAESCFGSNLTKLCLELNSPLAKSCFSSNLTKLSLDLSKEVLYDSVGPRAAKLLSLKVRQ